MSVRYAKWSHSTIPRSLLDIVQTSTDAFKYSEFYNEGKLDMRVSVSFKITVLFCSWTIGMEKAWEYEVTLQGNSGNDSSINWGNTFLKTIYVSVADLEGGGGTIGAPLKFDRLWYFPPFFKNPILYQNA